MCRALDRQQADRKAPGVIELDFELIQGSFTLDVHTQLDGRAAALFGPSGAGKTTILDAIAGLRSPRHGLIKTHGRTLYSSADGVNLPPRARHVGYVPQDVALFPHMDVRGTCCMGVIRACRPSWRV